MARALAIVQGLQGLFTAALAIPVLINVPHLIFVLLFLVATAMVVLSVGVWRLRQGPILGSLAIYAVQVATWSKGEMLFGLRIAPMYGYRIDAGDGVILLNVSACLMILLYAMLYDRLRRAQSVQVS